MKKIFLISTYCDNLKKIKVLEKNLDIIKSFGFDSLVLSPIKLPDFIIEKCDFFYRTKENPVTPITEKCYIHWRVIDVDNKQYKLERFFPEYGWADLYQRKTLSNISLIYEYDIFYHIIYDTKFDDGLLNEINQDKFNVYYSNQSTNGDINEFSLHFLPLNKEMLIDFGVYLNKNQYISSHDLPHEYMLKWIKKNDIKKEKYIVQEEINYYDEINFFSQTKNDKFDIFLGKDETNKTTNSFIFYNVKQPITLIINDNRVFEICDDVVIKTNLYTQDIKSIVIRENGSTINYMEEYNKIERTLITKI